MERRGRGRHGEEGCEQGGKDWVGPHDAVPHPVDFTPSPNLNILFRFAHFFLSFFLSPLISNVSNLARVWQSGSKAKNFSCHVGSHIVVVASKILPYWQVTRMCSFLHNCSPGLTMHKGCRTVSHTPAATPAGLVQATNTSTTSSNSSGMQQQPHTKLQPDTHSM